MTSKEEVPDHFFRPKAKLLILLGEQLIKNEIVAISELVKNSYDADAKYVSVEILQGDVPKRGEIVVLDNGQGMSSKTILNVWLEPATDFRKRERESKPRKKGERRTLGEKGIGRFAAHKLGHIVELVTRTADEKHENVLDIDWRIFESDRYLDQIPIQLISREPEVFIKNSGTRIRVRELNSKWTESMIKDLYFNLESLTSPFQIIDDFKVKLDAPEFANVLRDLPPFTEVIEESPYLFQADVMNNGILEAKYEFQSKSQPRLNRTVSIKQNLTDDVVNHMRASGADSSEIDKMRNVDCGPFSMRLHVWDGDTKSRSEIRGGARYYRQVIRPQTGIRLYRDKFRVWPYGEENNDWLSMDLRRVNNPKQCISRNQVIGIIELEGDRTPELRDKTNREGLVENDSFKKFERLVVAALSMFEIERRKDRQQLLELRKKTMPKDKVIVSIDGIKAKVRANLDQKKYENDLASLVQIYQRRIDELLDPYLLQATLGIAYSIPIHEMRRDIGDLRRALKPIEDYAWKIQDNELLGQIDAAMIAIKHIESTINAVRRLLRRTSKATFKLSDVVKTALSIVRPRANRKNIQCDLEVETDSEIKGNERLITAAVLNLLDNSLYWVLVGGKSLEVRIIVDLDENDNPRIIVSDSGPGFEDSLEEVIQPFFTRKPEGSGLGLHIVDTIMKEHDGGILLLEKEKRFLDGANVALVFSKVLRT